MKAIERIFAAAVLSAMPSLAEAQNGSPSEGRYLICSTAYAYWNLSGEAEYATNSKGKPGMKAFSTSTINPEDMAKKQEDVRVAGTWGLQVKNPPVSMPDPARWKKFDIDRNVRPKDLVSVAPTQQNIDAFWSAGFNCRPSN